VLGHRGFAAPLLFNHHQGETLCQRKECFETEEQNLWRVMPRVVAESGGRVVAESGGREWWPSGGRVVAEWGVALSHSWVERDIYEEIAS
jgi:hypothetical protein